MLTEWEEKHGIKTQHVNISNNEDVKQKLANHEIDCFVSLEESYWAELGISTITRVGNPASTMCSTKTVRISRKNWTMRCTRWTKRLLFYTTDLCKKYFSLDYKPSLRERKRRGSKSTVRSGWAF